MRRLALLGALITLSGCADSQAAADFVTLADGTIAAPEAPYAAGWVALEIENVGALDHTLVVTREDGSAVAATDIVSPGEHTTLVVELAAGTYVVSCRIVVQLPDGSIMDHYELGMVSAITVEGESTLGDRTPTTTTTTAPSPATTTPPAAEPEGETSGGYGSTGNE